MLDPLPIAPLERPPDATVVVPGSKSLTNRALVCAALAAGESTITGALEADDTEAMRECLAVLGEDGSTLRARASGTTARFLLPVLAARDGAHVLDGDRSLRARPQGALLDAVRSLGATVDELGAPGCLPVRISGGPVAGGRVEVAGDITSQFLSGLLLAGPCFARGVDVVPTTELVSAPYVDMTAAVMRAFGASVEGLRADPGGYRATSFAIEPDASAASYFFAAAAFTGGRITVDGLGRGSLQGDLRFVDVLARMGAHVDRLDGATTVIGGELRGVDVDLRDMPDMAQTLAAVAVFADGPTTVRGIGFIRGHETDRIKAVVTELRRCGIEAHETEDGFTVVPGTPQPATIQTYKDHRMAMSFALLGLRAAGIAIADPGCVAKTFPRFFETLDLLR